MSWKDEVIERSKNKLTEADLAPVKVRNLPELKELLKNFKPEVDTMTNKLLRKGFEMVHNHLQFTLKAQLAKESDFGGIKPAIPQGIGKSTWVDNLVRTQMGGTRDGLKVVWELPEGKFEYYPLDHKLVKAD